MNPGHWIKKPPILVETDLKMLARITSDNCGLVLLLKHHNVPSQQDLDMNKLESEKEIIYESISDILTNLDPDFEKSIFFEKISITNKQV